MPRIEPGTLGQVSRHLSSALRYHGQSILCLSMMKSGVSVVDLCALIGRCGVSAIWGFTSRVFLPADSSSSLAFETRCDFSGCEEIESEQTEEEEFISTIEPQLAESKNNVHGQVAGENGDLLKMLAGYIAYREEIESEQTEEEEFISTIEPQLAESKNNVHGQVAGENGDLLKMLAGYIAYRVRKKKLVTTYEYGHPTSHYPTKQIDWLATISRGGLMEPTSVWAQVIFNMEEDFNTFHGGGLNKDCDVMKTLVNILNISIDEFAISCYVRTKQHPQYTQPGSNADIPAIINLVYRKSNALDQADDTEDRFGDGGEVTDSHGHGPEKLSVIIPRPVVRAGPRKVQEHSPLPSK
uniref:Uncharacterized protein n=1 Tax=Timema monikensis TaxID=170555 RepID=A0A7R9EHR2_9NEOP|nr:unnamed protein product [Timema monikensis]